MTIGGGLACQSNFSQEFSTRAPSVTDESVLCVCMDISLRGCKVTDPVAFSNSRWVHLSE